MKLYSAKKMAGSENKAVMSQLQKAIAGQCNLEILYSGKDGETTERCITPQAIEGRGAGTSVVAYCHLRQDKRSFRVDRIIRCREE